MGKEERIKRKMVKNMMKEKTDPVVDIKGNEFQQKVMDKSKTKPVVVDFWSPTCPPCRALGPVLEKIAKEYDGKFVLGKINITEPENQAIAQKYSIMSIPNVKMFKDGDIVDEFVGALGENQVKKWLDKNL